MVNQIGNENKRVWDNAALAEATALCIKSTTLVKKTTAGTVDVPTPSLLMGIIDIMAGVMLQLIAEIIRLNKELTHD